MKQDLQISGGVASCTRIIALKPQGKVVARVVSAAWLTAASVKLSEIRDLCGVSRSARPSSTLHSGLAGSRPSVAASMGHKRISSREVVHAPAGPVWPV